MMLRTALPFLAAAMLVLSPESASAQVRTAPADAAATALDAQPSATTAGRLAAARVPAPLRTPVATAEAPRAGREITAAPALQARDRGGIPFMVAGGALFVAGAVVGGDAGTLLMVGGAGVGAYGLYVYFGGS